MLGHWKHVLLMQFPFQDLDDKVNALMIGSEH